jgi:hypothetical protein
MCLFTNPASNEHKNVTVRFDVGVFELPPYDSIIATSFENCAIRL